jgi:hypothetical protein
MSSFEAAAFVAPVAPAAYVMFLSEVDRSVAADWSPFLRPSAWAAAAFALSKSEGTPLLSLISCVIFIMSRFLRFGQFLIQN